MTSERASTSEIDRDASRLAAEHFARHELPALQAARERGYQIAILQSVIDDIQNRT